MVIKNKVKSTIRDSPACSRLRRQPMAGRLFMIHSKGFTLIELLVAISIIGILSSFLLANFVGVRQRARDGVRKSDLRQIQSALELYRSDKGKYPEVGDPGFSEVVLMCGWALTSNGTIQNPLLSSTIYMKKTPCDPLGGSYTYADSSGGVSYSLTACLENANDSQLDTPKTECPGSTTLWKYTLKNP